MRHVINKIFLQGSKFLLLQNDINGIDINEQGNQHNKTQDDPYFKRSIDKTGFIRKPNGKIIDQVFCLGKIRAFNFWLSRLI